MPPSRAGWGEWLSRVEEWLLPAECLGCSRPQVGADAPLVCDLCRARGRALPHPQCERCGQPLIAGVSCRICPDWPRDFGPVRSACFVDPALRRLMHQFKYHGWRRLAESFAVPMTPLLEVFPSEAVLVPIPLAPGRQRMRGYNQAGELAAQLAGRSGRLLRPGLLERVRSTGTQTRLGRADRLANLAEAFRGRATARPVILVDDVFTTGATLVSAARALLDAGAPEVGAVTLARARPPLAAQAQRVFTSQ